MSCLKTMAPSSNNASKILDSTQYTNNGILRYESIFGEGFISSGGLRSIDATLAMIELKKGIKVLDIGCGIGGCCALTRERYDAEVLGIDLSSNVIQIANSRYSGDSNLQFKIADCCDDNIELIKEGYYDFIYSRDTILHLNVEQKAKLFKNIFRWLKPEGQLLITDYCCGPRSLWTESFTEYVKQRGYILLEIDKYANMLHDSGFKDCKGIEKTDLWITFLREELESLCENKDKFLETFTNEDLDTLGSNWKCKIERAEQKIHQWGWFIASKPL